MTLSKISAINMLGDIFCPNGHELDDGVTLGTNFKYYKILGNNFDYKEAFNKITRSKGRFALLSSTGVGFYVFRMDNWGEMAQAEFPWCYES